MNSQITKLKLREAALAAVKAAGGPSRVAKHFGYKNPWAVSKWARVPANLVMALAELTGDEKTWHDIRPDIYPVGMQPNAQLTDRRADNRRESDKAVSQAERRKAART